MKFIIASDGCGYYSPQVKSKWYKKWERIVANKYPDIAIKVFTKQEAYDIIEKYNFENNINHFAQL